MKLVNAREERKLKKTQKWMNSVTEDLNLVFSAEVVSECCFPDVYSYFLPQYQPTKGRSDYGSSFGSKLNTADMLESVPYADEGAAAQLYQELTQEKKRISNPILDSLQFYISQNDASVSNKNEWEEVVEAARTVTSNSNVQINSPQTVSDCSEIENNSAANVEESTLIIEEQDASDEDDKSEVSSNEGIIELFSDTSEEDENFDDSGAEYFQRIPSKWRVRKRYSSCLNISDVNRIESTHLVESTSNTSMHSYVHDVFWSPRIIRDIAEEWALTKNIKMLSRSLPLEELTMMLLWEKNLLSVLLTGVYVAPKYLGKSRVLSIGSVHTVLKWIDKVLDFLCYPDESIQIGAALTLLAWSEPAPEALQVLSGALRSLDLNSRWCAARCLTYLGSEMTSHLKPIITTMFSVLDSNLGPLTKSRALNLLAKLSTASAMVEILAKEKLNSFDNRDKIIACQVLRVLQISLRKPLIQQLIHLMWRHCNANVRQAAYVVLRRPECHSDILCFLHDIFKNPSTERRNIRDKIKAMKYLIHSGHITTQLLSASLECLRSDDEELRLNACEIVSHFKLKTDKAILELTRLTYMDTSPAVQLKAIKVLRVLRVVDVDVKDSLCWVLDNGLTEEIKSEAKMTLIQLGLLLPSETPQPFVIDDEVNVELKSKEMEYKDLSINADPFHVPQTMFRKEISPFILPPENFQCKSDSKLKQIECLLRQALHEDRTLSKSDTQLGQTEDTFTPGILPFSKFQEDTPIIKSKTKLKPSKNVFKKEALPIIPLQIEHCDENGISVYY